MDRHPEATFSCSQSALSLAIGTCFLLSGCANLGTPHPPSLQLPRLPDHLIAARIGTRVNLSWQTSPETTDGETLKGPIQAVLCRQALPDQECRQVSRFGIAPGNSQTTDVLPPTLLSAPPALLIYRIELRNRKDRSAGQSAPVYAVSGPAPPTVENLQITARRNAALLKWNKWTALSKGEDIVIEVSKTLLASTTPLKKSSPAAAQPATRHSPTAETRNITLLRTPAPDPGGILDRTIQDGDSVLYTAQRVETVSRTIPAITIPGKNGHPQTIPTSTQTFEIRSEPSPAVPFVFNDTQPPSPPQGLASIPSGGFGQPPAIDLSWELNPESDVIGFNIYRTESPTASSQIPLNPGLLSNPSFHDATAVPGHHYRYTVTAVDRRHHESAPSSPVTDEVKSSTP